MKEYTSSIELPFHIQAICENCGNQYDYDHKIGLERRSANASNASQALKTAIDNLFNQLNDTIRRGDFENQNWSLGKFRIAFFVWLPFPTMDYRFGLGDISCPQCSYCQSWQVPVRQARKAASWALVFGVLVGLILAAIVLFYFTWTSTDNALAEIAVKGIVGLIIIVSVSLAVRAILSPILFPLMKRLFNPNKAFQLPGVINKPTVIRPTVQ